MRLALQGAHLDHAIVLASGFNEQRTTLAQASGKLVDLPNHGDISVAFGGDYRHEAGALPACRRG